MDWHSGVRTSIRRPVLVGLVMLVVGFGGFGTWAAVAPLEGAVVAPGTVVASGRNKIVQHLEGGIVKKILVEEGDQVSRGDPVLLLDATAADAARNRLQVQLDVLDALEARAVAERDGSGDVVFPDSLLAKSSDAAVHEVIADQKAEFAARLDKHNAELAILEQQIAALGEEIVGLQAQREAVGIQLELIQEEKADSEMLLKKGLARKTRVLELRRTEAELIGQKGSFTAGIAKANQTIAEARQQKQRLKVARLEEAVKRLGEVRLQRSDLSEQLRTAQDVLDRIVVRTPVSGTVMTLTKFSPGAVISPGEGLMEIVPDESSLIVEAHVRPQDIDQVRIGQDARLNFSALDQREVPPVPGSVQHVSADRLTNETTGEPYYLVRLQITSDPVPGFDPAKVGPGQPVDVFITTGARTFVAYLTEPITKTMQRAVKEN